MGGENGYKKIALIFLCALLIGLTPVFAVNSDNITHEKQIETNIEKQYQNSTHAINNTAKTLHSFMKNNHVEEGIKEIFSDINKESASINDPRALIEESMQKESRERVLNSINQINDNNSEIKSFILENETLKKEIQILKDNENATGELISAQDQIKTNSSTIKRLIDENKDLINRINENT